LPKLSFKEYVKKVKEENKKKDSSLKQLSDIKSTIEVTKNSQMNLNQTDVKGI